MLLRTTLRAYRGLGWRRIRIQVRVRVVGWVLRPQWIGELLFTGFGLLLLG